MARLNSFLPVRRRIGVLNNFAKFAATKDILFWQKPFFFYITQSTSKNNPSSSFYDVALGLLAPQAQEQP